jgi:hypothetical protein
MTTGVVSLWHNAQELLPEFERLLSVGGWDRAILVDNASDADAKTAYQLSASRAGFEVLTLAENNVLRGWNTGMDALDTDVRVCMANDLVMVKPTWLNRVTYGIMPGIMIGPYPKRFIEGTVYLDGSLICYHALDWARLGGLDEGYIHPGYVSDVDICWRAGQLGIALRIAERVVCHLENYSTGVGKGKIHPTWPMNRDRFLAKKAAAQ